MTLKPSAGRIPLDAPYLGRCAGPMTRSVADAALLTGLLSAPDERDWTSLPPAELAWSSLDLDVRGLLVGLHLDAGCGGRVDPEIARAVSAAAAVFESAGAIVEPVEPFITPDLLDDLDLFLRVRSWNDFADLPPERQSLVLPYVARWCAKGAEVSGARLMECYQQIMRMQARTVAATTPFDLVLSPVAPVAAFAAEEPMPYPDNGAGMQHIGFTVPYNMSGQPAATVNAGFTADGRPIGVQISGRRFDDVGVLRAAAWFEHHRPATAIPLYPGTPSTA